MRPDRPEDITACAVTCAEYWPDGTNGERTVTSRAAWGPPAHRVPLHGWRRPCRAKVVLRLACWCVAGLLPMRATAATVWYLTDGQLVAASERIVHARVIGSRVEMDPDGLIHTATDLAVI